MLLGPPECVSKARFHRDGLRSRHADAAALSRYGKAVRRRFKVVHGVSTGSGDTPFRESTEQERPETKAKVSRNSYKGGVRPILRNLARAMREQLNLLNDL